MKKRKPARKAKKKSPTLKAKTLRSLGGAVLKSLPSGQWEPRGIRFRLDGSPVEQKPLVRRTSVGGYPLPPDLEDAILYYVDGELQELDHWMHYEPWQDDYDQAGNQLKTEADYPDWESSSISENAWFHIRYFLQDSFRKGFFLALLRYGDELKSHPEAAAMLAAARANSKKGAVARRKQAAPNHRKIQKLFRELRKTSPKKTVRYLRVAEEFKMSDRQIARIVDGID